jgi:hypothetical protein
MRRLNGISLLLTPAVALAQEAAVPPDAATDPNAWVYGALTMLIGVVAGALVSQYKNWREQVLHDNKQDWRDLAVDLADRLGIGNVPPGPPKHEDPHDPS